MKQKMREGPSRVGIAHGLVVGLAVAFSVTTTSADSVPLANATATLSQFSIGATIDGDNTDPGWAVSDGATTNQTAVFETTFDVGFAGGSVLTFTLHQEWPGYPAELLGRFRLSVTTDDRSAFADGLSNGGDVTADWTVLDPASFTSTNGATLTKLGDGSILASGTLPNTDVYTVVATTTVTHITGLRLEAMSDSSLPTAGPGRCVDGNFVLTEFMVDIRSTGLPVPPRYVWSGSPNEASPFDTWDKAAHTITNALHLADMDDVIIVTNGAYYGEGEINVPASVTVQGFSGNPSDVTVDGGGANRCFSLNAGATLKDITIQNGNVNGVPPAQGGAGVYCNGGMVSNCIIRSCQSTTYGGGVYCDGAAGLVKDCLIVSNSVSDPGGGVVGAGIYAANGRVDHCIIVSNSAFGAGAGGGGVATPLGSSPVITNCTISANSSAFRAGGLYLDGGLLVNCTLSGNQAVSDSGGLWIRGNVAQGCTIVSNTSSSGGGVQAVSGTVEDCLITGNGSTGGGGGGGVCFGGGATIDRCRIVGNWATGTGGGVQRWSQSGSVRDCLIAGNVANLGGGVCQNSGDIENCTIVRNEAGGGNSGGIYLAGGTVTNCVVYYNVATSDGDIHFAGGGECGYSCASNITPGNNGNIADAPGFMNIGSGSGTNNYVAGDYHLRGSSPCVDHGVNESWMSGAAVDLTGKARIYPADGTVDLGCYEVGRPNGTIITIR